MAEEFPRCWESIICLFYVVYLSSCALATFCGEVKNRHYHVFFNASRLGLRKSPNKVLTVRFCSKLSSVKCSARMRECLEGVKHSLFISISHSFLSFGSWVKLKVQTLDFEWFSSDIHCELKTKSDRNRATSGFRRQKSVPE